MACNNDGSATRPLTHGTPQPGIHALGWMVGVVVVVVCGIVTINTETQAGLTSTLLYITLLLMAAMLFSISAVIAVALMCVRADLKK